jgi:superfamily II DNA or RNA helicase
MISLAFASGTIEIRGAQDGVLPASCLWDDRTRCHRAPAIAYADVVRALRARGLELDDQARRYEEIDAALRVHREARPFQREALSSWLAAKGRGVVVLPTGAGKSHVALLAIEAKRRSTLVLAPTLDLVRQWYDLLRLSFDLPVGVIGGGEHRIAPLTVATYDSAYLHMEDLGARFGLAIFDECHHVPSDAYAVAARLCLAPFRLGLTATPDRADGRDRDLDELIGPIVANEPIGALAGEWLAEYETERVVIELSAEERAEYEAERDLYRAFLKKHGIRMRGPEDWGRFIQRSTRSAEGRRAMLAYRRQKQIALTTPAKLGWVEHLLDRHRSDATLLFTDDNATAHVISRRFLVPVITHETKVSERSRILERFADGTYRAIVTSKVLNEGIDVPAASVAIVISGSGSVREHVQRLGRVLRKHGEKHAILYELISGGTAEAFTSERRREHDAYR